MGQLSINDTAAATRIAACLARSVTNSIIDSLARQLGFDVLGASNKARKIHLLLTELLADGRLKNKVSSAIASLTLQAHHRTVTGLAEMTLDEADMIVADMRTMGIPTGDLGRAGWRRGLKGSTPPRDRNGPAAAASGASPTSARRRQRPERHAEALAYLAQLAADNSRPQHRGLELEKIVFSILKKEELDVLGNIVNPGEQIDLAFAMDGQHYLVETKWEAEAVGLPIVTAFAAKISRKAEGTFGVLISMSGFVRNINDTAARGARLNCVGIAHRQIIDVLEGRTTFVDLVRSARASASTRARFFETA